ERSRSAEDKHKTLATHTVWSRLKCGIICKADIGARLDEGENMVVAQTTAAEIIILVIPGGLCEPHFIEPIMIPIPAPKQLHGRSTNVVRRGRRQIEREVEDPVGVADGTGLVRNA